MKVFLNEPINARKLELKMNRIRKFSTLDLQNGLLRTMKN